MINISELFKKVLAPVTLKGALVHKDFTTTAIAAISLLALLCASASARTITVGHTPSADYWNIQDAIMPMDANN